MIAKQAFTRSKLTTETVWTCNWQLIESAVSKSFFSAALEWSSWSLHHFFWGSAKNKLLVDLKGVQYKIRQYKRRLLICSIYTHADTKCICDNQYILFRVYLKLLTYKSNTLKFTLILSFFSYWFISTLLAQFICKIYRNFVRLFRVYILTQYRE